MHQVPVSIPVILCLSVFSVVGVIACGRTIYKWLTAESWAEDPND